MNIEEKIESILDVDCNIDILELSTADYEAFHNNWNTLHRAYDGKILNIFASKYKDVRIICNSRLKINRYNSYTLIK